MARPTTPAFESGLDEIYTPLLSEGGESIARLNAEQLAFLAGLELVDRVVRLRRVPVGASRGAGDRLRRALRAVRLR